MKLLLSLIVLLGLAGCAVSFTSTSLVSKDGTFIDVRYRDGVSLYAIVGSQQYEGVLAVFRLATPLTKAEPEDSASDVVFTCMENGKAVSKFILHRDGELFHDGKWFVVDQDWLYRWQSKYDRRNSSKPNKSPVPPPPAVKPATEAPIAPDASAAHR